MSLMPDAEVDERLARLSGWQREGARIRRVYTFPGFTEAMAFVNRVAELAEQADHHPDILVEYSKVTLTLSSHDVGGLTARDLRLAEKIDS
jgi:4a-hydroxytetrahydrobiopterin dehydratase